MERCSSASSADRAPGKSAIRETCWLYRWIVVFLLFLSIIWFFPDGYGVALATKDRQEESMVGVEAALVHLKHLMRNESPSLEQLLWHAAFCLETEVNGKTWEDVKSAFDRVTVELPATSEGELLLDLDLEKQRLFLKQHPSIAVRSGGYSQTPDLAKPLQKSRYLLGYRPAMSPQVSCPAMCIDIFFTEVSEETKQRGERSFAAFPVMIFELDEPSASIAAERLESRGISRSIIEAFLGHRAAIDLSREYTTLEKIEVRAELSKQKWRESFGPCLSVDMVMSRRSKVEWTKKRFVLEFNSLLVDTRRRVTDGSPISPRLTKVREGRRIGGRRSIGGR